MAKTAFLYVEGEICPDFTEDVYYDYPHTSLAGIRTQLAAYPEAEEIQVIINSFGGQITEGFAIYDYLKSFNKPITTIAIGSCMSMATVIFMAGETRLMSENAQFMVHLPSGGVWGNQADIESYLNWIKQDTERITNLYVKATGQDAATITDLLTKESFLLADECLRLGFATGIHTPAVAKAKAYYPKKPATNKPVKTQNKGKMKIAKTKEGRAKAALVAMAAGQAIENKEFALQDGQKIDIDTAADAPSEGDEAKINGQPAPDGKHVLAGDLAGVEVETKGGEIVNIVVPETTTEESATQKPTNSADIEARLTALENENRQLKATQAAWGKKMGIFLGDQRSADVNVTPSASGTVTTSKRAGTDTTNEAPKSKGEESTDAIKALREKAKAKQK